MSEQQPPAPDAWGTCPPPQQPEVESAAPARATRHGSALHLARRALRKLLWLAVVFFGITVISFWVIHLAPGSPTDL